MSLSSKLPSNINLVYWDYYHTMADSYIRKIKEHRDLGFEPWVAGGIWTWNRLVTALPFTFESSRACLSACKSSGIKNVFVTVWGDDGNEFDVMSALPGFQYYSEQCYAPGDDVLWDRFRYNFAGVCGGKLEDWVCPTNRFDITDVCE